MPKRIFSDTSCLIALSNVGKLEILNNLFGEVVITGIVATEFKTKLPDWLIIKEVHNQAKQLELEKHLDKGEASIIALALEHPGCTLVIDEFKGRKIACSLGLDIIGTIGLLILAEKSGAINNPVEIAADLMQTGFRLSPRIFNKLKKLYNTK